MCGKWRFRRIGDTQLLASFPERQGIWLLCVPSPASENCSRTRPEPRSSPTCVCRSSASLGARVPSSLCCFLKASTLSPALHVNKEWCTLSGQEVALLKSSWHQISCEFVSHESLGWWGAQSPPPTPGTMWYHRWSATLETCDAPPGAWGLVPGEFLPCCIGSVLPLALLGLSFQLVWKWSSVGVCRGMVCSMLRKRLRALFLRLCCLLLGAC